MIIGFGNNVVSSLAADITATQTTIQVMPGAGALFAGLLTYDYANDSNSLKVYAKITLTDAKETVFEVCHLTAVNNDMLTVVRGQEGTAAKGWSLNDVIANFATRGSENQFVQIEQLQSGHYTSAVAGGTANGLTLALPATFFLNGSTEWALKTPILIYPTLNNTGASTLQLTMGGRVMGTYPLVKGSNTALRAGDIVAKNPFLAVFNADQGRFIVLNPTTDVGSVRSVNSIGPDAGGNVAIPMYGLGLGPIAKTDAYSNIAQFYRVNASAANKPPAVSGNVSAGIVCLPMDAAPSSGYVAVVGGNLAAYVGISQAEAGGITWARIYTDKFKPTAADVGLGNVGNFMAVQQGGGANQSKNKVYIGWGNDGILRCTVDTTDLGQIFTTKSPPSAAETGAFPKTGGNLFGSMNAVGSVGTQGGAFLIRNSDGVQVASVSAGSNGSISVYSDVTGRSFGIGSDGGFFTSSGVGISESGQRVYSPNNPPPSQTDKSVSGDGWWYRDSRTGIIFQGGFASGSADPNGAIDRIPLNIAVPNRLLFVSTIIRNYAQGYQTTWNPQTRNLSGERNGFDWIHGSNEREVYWLAIGY